MLVEDIDIVQDEGIPYVNIVNAIKVLRNTEYDSLEKAAAEIIDNSIDAEATVIDIFINTKYDSKSGKNKVGEIAFLDNGKGMTRGRLQHIIAYGTGKQEGENKIGKFGAGLKQASLFACNTFYVYTWQNEGEVYLETFDSEYIMRNNIQIVPVPTKTKLPEYVLNSSIYKNFCKNHGTLVVWTSFRNSKVVKASTQAKHIKEEIGRIFRYFIAENKINLYTEVDSKEVESIPLIDPMCLLENDYFMGDKDGFAKRAEVDGEPLFEPFKDSLLYDGKMAFSVPYYKNADGEKGESKVTIRAAVIKKKFYYDAAIKSGCKQPGDTDIGKHLKDLQRGITVVRNNREIDFDYFNLYDSNNQPQDRWFKLEIIFTDKLDDIFGVSNNKQHVEIKQYKSLDETDEKSPEYPIWSRLQPRISKLLSLMRKRNAELAKEGKAKVDGLNKPEYKEEKEEKQNGSLKLSSTLDISENVSVQNELDNDEVIIIEETETPEEKIIKKLNAEISFDLSDDISSFSYDSETGKSVLRFNLDKIVAGRLDINTQILILKLYLAIENNKYSQSKYVLEELLNNYKKYISGGE